MGYQTVVVSVVIFLCSVHISCAATGQQTSCLNGFIETLPKVGGRNNRQYRVIPGINFTCDGSITGWTIGARWRTDGNRDFFPYLLIWRSAGGDNYTLEGSTQLFVPNNGRANDEDYFFNGFPDPPLEFQAGDVLGVFQPTAGRSRVRLNYEPNTGPTSFFVETLDISPPLLDSLTITDSNVLNDTDFPAIILQIGQQASCSNGFSETLPNGETTNDQQYRVIPGINFTCNGSITGWKIGARWSTDGFRDSFPYLLIWRSAGDENYTLEGSTQLFVPDNGRANDRDYFFSGFPDPPLEFQAGDVLGFFQPCALRSRVGLNYEPNTGPSSFSVDTDDISPPLLDSLTITDSNVLNDTDSPVIILQIVNCPLLDDPISGDVEATTDGNGTTCSVYTCDQGYRLIGNAVRTCQADGTWTGTEPTCALLISLELPSYTVREDLTDGKGFALLICAFLQEQITQNATVVLQAFTSEDDTATEGEDFTATEQLLTFPANSSKRQCGCIQILNDATNESSEVFTTMLSSTNAVQLANATVTILDDDSDSCCVPILAVEGELIENILIYSSDCVVFPTPAPTSAP